MLSAHAIARRFVAPRRVAQRFLRAKAPQVSIQGKKYVLSDVWGMLGDVAEALGGGKPGGPKVVDMGSGRFSWLWAYDPDKQTVAMWRWSDGDEKLYDKATRFMRDLHKIQQRGQLNRVTTDEMRMLERFMIRKQDETLKQLKQTIEDNKDEFERKIGQLVREFFDKSVRPKIIAQLVMVENGWRPPGFKPMDMRTMDEERQAKAYAAGQIMKKDFSLEKIDEYVIDQFEGIDPLNAPGVDSQLTYWEQHDVMDEFYQSVRM